MREDTSPIRRRCQCPTLLHASHNHTQMGRLNDYHNTLGG